MTKEEKELLMKDLSARLPYGVICQYIKSDGETMDMVFKGKHFDYSMICKPYLRSVSTMTMEEQFQLGKLLGAAAYNLLKGEYSSLKELLEYSYKNHIDLFGLIPKGLALEAPEDMYK